MKKAKWAITTLVLAMIVTASSAATQATTLRAFVSSTGNNANAATNCAQTAPCRTFAGAYPTVTAGGELIALDTAGYGPLNIDKAITIATVPGATAFVVVAAATAGFTVNAGATALVVLRNINFNGSNAFTTVGINHISGKLEVHNSTFAQLTRGIQLQDSKADLYNCIFVGNETAADVDGTGVDAFGGGTATALLTISGGSITNNGTAFSTINPGASPKYNIWVHGTSNGVWLTNIAHNTVLILGGGTGCPCTNVGTYNGAFGNPH